MQRARLLRDGFFAAYRGTYSASGSSALALKAKQSLSVTRLLSTNSTVPPDDEEVLRMISDPSSKVRDVYMSEDGEELFTVEADADLTKIDWERFERAFGLNSAVTDEEVDAGWEELKRKYNVKTKAVPAGNARYSKLKQRSRPSNGHSFLNKRLSLQFVDEEAPTTEAVPFPEFNVEPDTVHDRGAQLSDVHQVTGKTENTANAGHVENRGPQLTLGSVKLPEEAQQTINLENADAFKQPVNKERPGFERRVMSMESEMEKIVVDVLCNRDSEWYAEGGDVERVLLSPNMKNLTVYYTVAHCNPPRSPAWWRKSHRKFAAKIRATLAQQLETRYVPTVHLEQAECKTDSEQGGGSDLDQLFDQIAAERGGTGRANEDLSSAQSVKATSSP